MTARILVIGWSVLIGAVILIAAFSYLPTHLTKHGPPHTERQQMYDKCMLDVKGGNEHVCTDMLKVIDQNK